MENDLIEYKVINFTDGSYLQIKFEYEGIAYDMFDSNDEIIESFGYDFYEETVIPDYLQHLDINP